jgi:hypothetical protein
MTNGTSTEGASHPGPHFPRSAESPRVDGPSAEELDRAAARFIPAWELAAEETPSSSAERKPDAELVGTEPPQPAPPQPSLPSIIIAADVLQQPLPSRPPSDAKAHAKADAKATLPVESPASDAFAAEDDTIRPRSRLPWIVGGLVAAAVAAFVFVRASSSERAGPGPTPTAAPKGLDLPEPSAFAPNPGEQSAAEPTQAAPKALEKPAGAAKAPTPKAEAVESKPVEAKVADPKPAAKPAAPPKVTAAPAKPPAPPSKKPPKIKDEF